MAFAELLLFGLVLLPGAALVFLFLLSTYNPWPKRRLEFMIKERFKYNPKGQEETFQCLFERHNVHELKELKPTDAGVYLSVIVPAMNEEKRLPVMLDESLAYLSGRAEQDKTFTYEVIVVDDGSVDKTSDVAFEYSKRYPLSVHKLAKNVGKGGAVRCGVLCARGSLILFADADGATKFSEFEKLEKELLKSVDGDRSKLDNAVAIGSRAHLEKDSIAERSLFRTFLMIGFHLVVYCFTVRSVNDTQCGFKLFTRKAAALLFPRIHVERWAFDVEVLYICEKLSIPISEIPVEWHEVQGSKITPLFTALEMGRDIILVWFRYLVGIWRVDV